MVGTEYPAEKRRFIDEKTGNAIWQLTTGAANNYHFYFTDNSFTLGKDEIYFLSDRAAAQPYVFNLFRMDLGSGAIVQMTDEPDGINPGAHTKSPDSEFIVYATGSSLKVLHTDTLKTTVIFEESPNYMLGHPHIAPNKKYIGLTRNERSNVYRSANYQGFKEQMFAIKEGYVTLVNIDGSKALDIWRDTHWLGHFQFSPHDAALAMFCHEGPWNLVQQRIWLLDLVARKVTPCFRQAEDDSVGHEFWTRDGSIFFDNRRKGHDGTITSDRTQATITVSVDSGQQPYVGLADSCGKVIKTFVMPYYCNHYYATSDSRILVGDQVEDIVVFDLAGEEVNIRTLCSHQTSWYTQQTHCHPTFSWDDTKLLFASDRSGSIQLYMLEQPDGKWL